jgi:hypothetical protein
MIWVILGLLFVFILFISGQDGLPEEEDEIYLYFDEEDELLEDEILLYFDEEDEEFDDEDERS